MTRSEVLLTIPIDALVAMADALAVQARDMGVINHREFVETMGQVQACKRMWWFHSLVREIELLLDKIKQHEGVSV